MPEFKDILREKVERIRKLGGTIKELARRSGVSPASVSNWMSEEVAAKIGNRQRLLQEAKQYILELEIKSGIK